jgi:hypothetical protein
MQRKRLDMKREIRQKKANSRNIIKDITTLTGNIIY